MFGRKVTRSAPDSGNSTPQSPLAKEIGNILSQSAGQHPLDVAARLTALFSTQDYDDGAIYYVRIQNIEHPCVCDLSQTEGNPLGLSFSFYGANGETGLIYLTTAFGQLAVQGANPGPRVPVEMISRFVKNYDEAVRKLVYQRTPQCSQEGSDQEQRIKSQLSKFLG